MKLGLENIRAADMLFASIIFGCIGVTFPIILAIYSKFVLELEYVSFLNIYFSFPIF
jgi:hypothetical protein